MNVLLSGAPVIRDGKRVTAFDLSMLSEPKTSQVLMQLALKVPTEDYFSCVRYLHLSSDCMNSPGEEQAIAAHALLDTERESEWVQVTINCNNCNWELLQEVHLVLQLRDVNNATVAFTEETAPNLKSFLILFAQKSLFPTENIREAVGKRQAEDSPETPTPSQRTPAAVQNRTTLAEVMQRNVTCSRHVVFLATDELHYTGEVLAPTPGAIKLTYCFGKCSYSDTRLPHHNDTRPDPRTQILMHQMHNLQSERRYPPPCCIPNTLIATKLIIENEGVVDLTTFPNALDCKCQL